MPVYDQTYRPYDGAAPKRFRWLAMVRQEWSIFAKLRLFRLFQFITALHLLLYIVLIFAVDGLQSMPDHPLRSATQNMGFQQIDDTVFYLFITLQSGLVFFTLVFIGSGFISKDFRYNLVEVYFSKPLSWVDYVIGKTVTLVSVGLSMTALPALLMLLLHICFLPSWSTLEDSYWLPIPILLFSLAIALPIALAVLASSSFFNIQLFSGVAVVMLVVITSAIVINLSVALDNISIAVLSAPVAVNRLGEWFFQRPNLRLEVSPTISLAYMAFVCVVAASIVCLKVRRVGSAG